MRVTKVRNYSKRGDALPIPNLVEVQQAAYERFLQLEKSFDERDENIGLESLLREVFPIEILRRDDEAGVPLLQARRAPLHADECRELRLTYGMPFRDRRPPPSAKT
jgi:DNA-directed RNA polymerase subunit beta